VSSRVIYRALLVATAVFVAAAPVAAQPPGIVVGGPVGMENNAAGTPSLCSRPGGGVLVTWVQGTHVLLRALDFRGNPVGSPVVVAQERANALALAPSVGCSPSSRRAAVAWLAREPGKPRATIVARVRALQADTLQLDRERRTFGRPGALRGPSRFSGDYGTAATIVGDRPVVAFTTARPGANGTARVFLLREERTEMIVRATIPRHGHLISSTEGLRPALAPDGTGGIVAVWPTGPGNDSGLAGAHWRPGMAGPVGGRSVDVNTPAVRRSLNAPHGPMWRGSPVLLGGRGGVLLAFAVHGTILDPTVEGDYDGFAVFAGRLDPTRGALVGSPHRLSTPPGADGGELVPGSLTMADFTCARSPTSPVLTSTSDGPLLAFDLWPYVEATSVGS